MMMEIRKGLEFFLLIEKFRQTNSFGNSAIIRLV